MLAALLAEHQIGVADGGTAYASRCPCSCGEKNEIRNGTRQQARRKALAHLASVLSASDWLADVKAGAWDEGVGYMAERCVDEHGISAEYRLGDNPYRTTENTEPTNHR